MFRPSQRSTSLLALAVSIYLFVPCCLCDKLALDVFDRACHCFDDPNIYSRCAEEFRLNVEGAFHVQKDAVDAYCGGPCLEETSLALQCVEEVAFNSFRFSNGASVLAVKQALDTGCSYGPERGTFEIRERKECVGGEGEYYYHAPRDHVQEKPVGGRYYGDAEGSEQPYHYHQEEEPHYGEGGGEEYCYGDAAGRLAQHRSFLAQLLLVASAAALLLLAL
ncbi:hypothetical protein ACP4OV_016206 [Aristida adscensionis]